MRQSRNHMWINLGARHYHLEYFLVLWPLMGLQQQTAFFILLNRLFSWWPLTFMYFVTIVTKWSFSIMPESISMPRPSFIEWKYSAIVTGDFMAISHRCLPHGRAPHTILFCALLFTTTPSTAMTLAALPCIVTPPVLLCYCLTQGCSQHPQNKHRMSLNKSATKLLASQSSKTFLWFLLASINSRNMNLYSICYLK